MTWKNEWLTLLINSVFLTLNTSLFTISKLATLFLVSQVKYPGREEDNFLCYPETIDVRINATINVTETININLTSFNNDNETICSRVTRESGTNAGHVWIWCLFTALFFPDILQLIHSGFLTLTQGSSNPSNLYILISLFCQTIHSFGLCVLFFIALPNLRAVEMLPALSCVCFFPSLLNFVSSICKKVGHGENSNKYPNTERYPVIVIVFDLFCLLIQIAGILCWVFIKNLNNDHPEAWSILVGLFCTSFGWWEVFSPYVPSKKKKYQGDKRVTSSDSIIHTDYTMDLYIAATRILVGILFLWTFFEVEFNMSFKTAIDNLSISKSEYESNFGGKFNLPSFGDIPDIDKFRCWNDTTGYANEHHFNYTAEDPEDKSNYWTYSCNTTILFYYTLCPTGRIYSQIATNYLCETSDVECCVKDVEQTDFCPTPILNESVSISYVSKTPNSTFSLSDSYESEHFYPRVQNGSESISLSDTYPKSNFTLSDTYESKHFYPLIPLGIQIVSSFFAYYFASVTLQARTERIGFIVPAYLSNIVVIALLSHFCNSMFENSCVYEDYGPSNVFFNCFSSGNYWFGFLYFFTLISQAWITKHVFLQKAKKISQTHELFMTYFYSPCLIEQSLFLNRRKKEVDKKTNDFPYKVYGCATLWHETEDEMEKLLLSIISIDKYKKFQEKKNIEDKDVKYKFEMHLIFDNAFENGNYNKYVMLLIQLLNKKNINIKERFKTPYGEMITWRLEDKETMIKCHLKDKTKIRIKKRWSQILYFFNILELDDFKVVQRLRRANIYDKENDDEKKKRHQNTFVLALDGDSEFGADSISKLLDHMVRDQDLGAVCGRIHPMGSGLLYWYQKFEYGLGHWLQKSTEDTLGNVLCSPGCFSMYRLYALVENPSFFYPTPAIEEFAQESKTAIEFIQHDMGEDRWLCSLLISRGWKVKYSSIADLYTACPEGFDEYFKQRRRWMSSTLGNLILILQMSPKLLRRGHLTIFHVLYQVLSLFSSLIGPGTIIILLFGGFQLTFDLQNGEALACAVTPIVVFILICFFCKPKTQLLFAKFLSIFYGLVMIVVFVMGIVEGSKQTCFWNPTVFSFVLTVGSFVVVGLFHPKEITCLFGGLIYAVAIPCMFVILPIYSVMNLDDETWGTREDKPATSVKSDSSATKLSIFQSVARSLVSKESNQIPMQVEIPEVVSKKGTTELQAATGMYPSKYKIPNFSDELNDNEEERISKKEVPLTQEVLEEYLVPPKEKVDLNVGLRNLKNISALVFIFINAIWIIFIFRVHVSEYSVEWKMCKTEVPVPVIWPSTTTTTTTTAQTQPQPPPIISTTTTLSTTTVNEISPSSILPTLPGPPPLQTIPSFAPFPARDEITPTPTATTSPTTLPAFLDLVTERPEVVYGSMSILTLIFLILFVALLIFQVIGMLEHRVQTIAHIIGSRKRLNYRDLISKRLWRWICGCAGKKKN